MKKSEVIERILAYHPLIEDYSGCDGYKSGGEEDECTGIAVALVPTMEAIEKCAGLGANLLVVHEPIYYQTPDFPEWKGCFENSVQREKESYIREHGITIWRDHDHMHFHQPDSIFTGVIKYLGWEQYLKTELSAILPLAYVFDIPECTVYQLAAYLADKIGMKGLRYVGRKDDKVSRVALAAHLYPNSFITDGIKEDGFYHSYCMELMNLMESCDVDALIPGEIIEWTILSYINDAAYMGRRKACFNIGHFNLEELGMKYAAEWIAGLVENKVPVSYLPGGCWEFL